MSGQTDPLTMQKRWELIKDSFQIILSHLLGGVGIGSYLIAQSRFISKYALFFNQPVHNIFLLLVSELGFPLGLYIFYLVFRLYRKFFNMNFFLIIFAIFVTGFFDHYWITLQQNYFLLGFIGGYILNRKKIN